MMDGRGTVVYPDGSRYVGTWKRGLREGRGTITFANDSTYEGHFREDKFDMTGNTGTFTLAKPTKRENTGERVIPVNMNQDLSRIHLRAGFTEHGT
jgi:radial spoke head protein 1